MGIADAASSVGVLEYDDTIFRSRLVSYSPVKFAGIVSAMKQIHLWCGDSTVAEIAEMAR